MSLELISTPLKARTEDSETTNKVNWLMAHNPLYYGIQRVDYLIDKVTLHGDVDAYYGYTRLYFFNLTGWVAGESIIVRNNAGIPDGTYEILYVASTYFILNYTFVGGINIYYGGSFNSTNGKTNYYIKLRIYDGRTGTYQSLTTTDSTLLSEHNVRTDNNGLAKFDLSGFVKNLFEFKTDYDYLAVNEKDLYNTKKIIVYAQENYTNSSTDFGYIFSANLVNGAKQIQDLYGASAVDYCYDSLRNLTEKAKFLTLYKPKYFSGYPFSLSFINLGLGDFSESYEEGFVSNLIKVESVSGVETETTLLAAINQGYINHLKLTGGYSVDKIFVKIKQDGDVVEDAYVAYGYVAAGYVDGVITDTLADITLTENLQVNINQECITTPLYFRWLNQLGGWNYWLFSTNYFEQNTALESEAFEQLVEDIETATGILEYLKRESENKITIGAENLSENDKRLVLSMARSRKVQMYNETSTDWTDVIVIPGSYQPIEARESKSSVQLDIMLPKLYLQ